VDGIRRRNFGWFGSLVRYDPETDTKTENRCFRKSEQTEILENRHFVQFGSVIDFLEKKKPPYVS
jgi:hypothetical protein